MKKIFYIAFISLFISGCGQSQFSGELDEAQSMIENNPDSALVLLSGIKPDLLKSEKDKARYSLLWNLAQYKLFNDSLDENAVKLASEYFISINDKENSALSLYLLGEINHIKGKYGASVVALNRGLELSAESGNHYYEALCSKALYGLFVSIYDSHRQVLYAERAYNSFKLAGKSDWVPYALLELAGAYNNNMQFDKSFKIATQLMDSSEVIGDSILTANAAQTAAISAFGIGKNEMALSCYAKVMRNDSTLLNENDWYNIQVALAESDKSKISDKDLAVLNHNQSRNNQTIPFMILASQGNYKEAYNLLNDYRVEQDSIIRMLFTLDVDQSIQEYQSYKNEILENNLKSERMIWLIGCVGIIVISLCVGLWLRSRFRVQQCERENLMMQADELAQMTIIQQQRNTLLSETVRELFSQKFSVMNQLCASYYESKDKKIAVEVEGLIKKMANDSDTLKELEDYVNRYADNLMENFRNDFPNLRSDDYRLFLYSVIGFTARSISLFLSEKIEVIYNRKSRLKAKIKSNSNKSIDKYLAYTM